MDNRFELFIDICSGTIPFKEREQGMKLLNEVSSGDLIQVESLHRLGRDCLDTLSTLNLLKNKNVVVELKDLGVKSLLDNGKSNPAFEIITSVLSIIHQQTRENILESQKKGIAVAQAKGLYKGRKRGAIEGRGNFLKKHAESIRIIKRNPTASLRDLAKLTNRSHVTVKKIKEML